MSPSAPMNAAYLDAIRKFEGFTPKANWDYAQFTNGYGTKAKFAGEVIDKVEADRRFSAEISEARAFVEQQVPGADEGTKAALTSLTFNAGRTWSKSGLGEAVRAGDLDKARSLFLQYTKAGGEILPGLVTRRLAEATWIGSSDPGTLGAAAMASAVPSPALGALSAMAKVAEQSSGGVPLPSSSSAYNSSPSAGGASGGVAAQRANERTLALMSLSNAGQAEAAGASEMLGAPKADPDATLRADASSSFDGGMSALLEQLQIMRFSSQPGVVPSAALLLHDALARLGRTDQEKRG